MTCSDPRGSPRYVLVCARGCPDGGFYLRLRELTGERAYEAELAECAGVTGYHRWFFLTALAAALVVVPLLLRRRGLVSTVNYLPVSQIGPVLRGDALRRGQADVM